MLVALEDVEKRQVAVLIGLLEDVVEVADGLVIVQDEDQAGWCCDMDGPNVRVESVAGSAC